MRRLEHRFTILKRLGLCFLLSFTGASAFSDDRDKIESLSVFGTKENLPTRPGSAHLINQAEIEQFDLGDIHRILRSVPGVNIQEEDGYGLRPNIGLRGAHPHRSKKITLMEDGVLIAPAPYAAPAAYFFPMMDKISTLEVFKGSPAVQYGPNSIGGAINLVSKINNPGVLTEVAVGHFDFRKVKVSAGIDAFGDWSFDILRMETTGFKELNTQPNTGFVRQNVGVRWDKAFGPMNQSLTAKFNWAGEESNETYMGISQSDFETNPLQRYSATQKDKMTWDHRQFFLSYTINPFENWNLRATAYRHEFERSWLKVNGFFDNGVDPQVSFREVLLNPDLASNNIFFQVLRGDLDSGALSSNRDVIDLGNNQRQYVSHGLQFNSSKEWFAMNSNHLLQMNYRLHQDYVDRFHESSYHNMVSGQLVDNTSLNQQVTLLNRSQALAHTFAFQYEIAWDNLTATLASRFEDIQYEQHAKTMGVVTESSDQVFAPGIGFFYQTFANTGFLFGIHQGFTPVGPGQSDDIKPEEAINYELGVRHTGKIGAELIGFYSDYSNILGTCTQSAGCTVAALDQRTNGGEAEILGAELLLKTEFKQSTWTFPVGVTATYTSAQFKNTIVSGLSEWGAGTIEPGDPVPYIPEWQGNINLGVHWNKWRNTLNFNYLGEMFDQAVAQNRQMIDARFVLDWTASYQVTESSVVRLRVDNLLNEAYVVSLRPFGLRPGRPRSFILSYRYGF